MDTLPRPESWSDAVLVTHRGCLDGAGCALIWGNFFPAGEVRYVVAGQLERFVKEDLLFQSGRFLVIADIGLNSQKYADILEKRGNLVLLDHHKTSLHLQGRPWAKVDMARCGTSLLRDYLGLDLVADRQLAGYIEDHDLWGGGGGPKHQLSSDLATLMTFYGQERFVRFFTNYRHRFDGVFGLSLFLTLEERTLVEVLKAKRDESIEWLLGRVVAKEVLGPDGFPWTVGYVVSSEPHTSLLLDRMLESNPKLKAACQVNPDKGSVSLRSHGDTDVSALAAMYGGGGHRNAAGHPLPQSLREQLLEVHQ